MPRICKKHKAAVEPNISGLKMTLKEELKNLIVELDRVHPDGFVDGQLWRVAGELPDFATAQNGLQRYFTKEARATLRNIAGIIHDSNAKISSVIELENFEKIVRQCVADLHAADEFGVVDLPGFEVNRKKLVEHIEARMSVMQLTFTHYFSAWTFGMEREHPFVLGPVTIMTREQWIDSVKFHDTALETYLGMPEENAKWKDILKEALGNGSSGEALPGLAGAVFSAIHECPSVLKITVTGYEKDLSRKVAEIVCKSTLDALSLLFGGNEHFHQQALSDERLQPVGSNSVIETNGFLWLPGSKIGPRVRHLSYPRVRDYLAENGELLAAFASILNALVDPTTSRYPNLSKRWATALDWMAEGNREKNDAVALAKIASSLDVLACGGKFGGILNMLVHLAKITEDTIVVTGRTPRSLRHVVKDIYDNGRSQILHGTHFDRLKSFEVWKGHAVFFARLALIECALRLTKFTGIDGDTEFRTMPE